MKRFCLILFVSLGLMACNENKKQQQKDCVVELKELLKDELTCTKAEEMQVNLFVGSYKGEEVYFPMLVCPACDAQAPSYGYTCAKTKVSFEKFEDVKDVKLVYNSCDSTFSKSR